MNTKAIIEEIEKRREAVGKERDKLSDSIMELEALKYSCDEAWDCLQRAVDALSEQA